MSEARDDKVSPEALGLMALITVFWGINWPAMKLALADVPPWTFRTLCLAVGGLSLLALARLSGARIGVPRDRLGWLAVASLTNITGWHLLTAFGLLTTGGGRAAILAYTMPLWATVLSMAWLGERPTARRFLGLGLGLLGMVVLLGPEAARLGEAPTGALLIVLGSMCWAIGTVVMKKVDWGTPITALLGWQQLLGGVPVAIGWLAFEHAWFDVGSIGMGPGLALLYCVFIPMVVCYWAYFRVVTLLPASLASLSTLATPVVGVFSAAWLLGEPIGWMEILSLLLVGAALLLVLKPPGPRPLRRRSA